MFLQVNLVLNIDPAERNRKSMMNYLTEYIREVPLNSKAKQAMARNYAFHLQVSLLPANNVTHVIIFIQHEEAYTGA